MGMVNMRLANDKNKLIIDGMAIKVSGATNNITQDYYFGKKTAKIELMKHGYFIVDENKYEGKTMLITEDQIVVDGIIVKQGSLPKSFFSENLTMFFVFCCVLSTSLYWQFNKYFIYFYYYYYINDLDQLKDFLSNHWFNIRKKLSKKKTNKKFHF